MDAGALNYQKKDRELLLIERELQDMPERRAAMRAKNFILSSEETTKRLEDRSAELLAIYARLQAAVEAQKKDVLEYEKLSKEALGDLDELAYLSKKVNKVIADIKALEKQFNSVTGEIAALGKEYSAFRKNFTQAKEDYLKNRKLYDNAKSERNSRMESIRAELKDIAERSDKALIDKYLKKRNDKIYPVFVPINGKNCGGCSMELFANDLDRLKREGVIECENCKRLIYGGD